jgi:hypothetical protein
VSPEGVAVTAILLLPVLLLAAPQIDLQASALFWSPAGFELAQWPLPKGLRKSSSWVLGLILLAVRAILAMHLVRRDWVALGGARRCCWFLLAGPARALAAGAGRVTGHVGWPPPSCADRGRCCWRPSPPQRQCACRP